MNSAFNVNTIRISDVRVTNHLIDKGGELQLAVSVSPKIVFSKDEKLCKCEVDYLVHNGEVDQRDLDDVELCVAVHVIMEASVTISDEADKKEKAEQILNTVLIHASSYITTLASMSGMRRIYAPPIEASLLMEDLSFS